MCLIHYKFINKQKALGMLSEESVVDDYAKKQFVYADSQNAREALNFAVKVHREMQGRSPLWGWPEKLDLAWCYAELSVLEESEGNAKLAGDYMSQAQQLLRELGLKDSSESHIRQLLAQRAVSSNQTSSVEPR